MKILKLALVVLVFIACAITVRYSHTKSVEYKKLTAEASESKNAAWKTIVDSNKKAYDEYLSASVKVQDANWTRDFYTIITIVISVTVIFAIVISITLLLMRKKSKEPTY